MSPNHATMLRIRTSDHQEPPKRQGPTTGAFFILLITLWALNLADIFQTLFLKHSGLLAVEANYFINFFLAKGVAPFFWAKMLAMILVTLMLFRGWFDKDGITFGSAHYEPTQVRGAIYFLLVSVVIYYTLIVGFPFFAMLLSGMFTSPEQLPA